MLNVYRIVAGLSLAFFTFAQFNGYTLFGSSGSGGQSLASRSGGGTYVGSGGGGRSTLSHK
jgi:hypothetical protein